MDAGTIAGELRSAKRSLRALGFGVVMLLAVAPLIWRFYVNLWRKEPYQFFPLALGGAAFLAWRAWESRPVAVRDTSWMGVVGLVAGGMALAAFAGWLYSPWVGMMALLMLLCAWAWATWGKWGVRAFLPALLMGAVTLPPPFNIDVTLTFRLREIATIMAGKVLDLLQVTHIRVGNIIELPGRRLLVDEACSGINSVVSTAAACLFYQLWMRRPWYQIALALPLTLGFVLCGNIFRIFSAAWLLDRHGVDLFAHGVHEGVGLALFAGYLVLIVCVDHLMCFVLKPPQPDPRRMAEARRAGAKRAPIAQATVFEAAWLPRLPLVALLVLGVTFWVRPHTIARGTPSAEGGAAGWPDHSALQLPDVLDGWQRDLLATEGPELVETGGLKSRSWRFGRRGLSVVVSIDYPIKGYHDVGQCYEGAGWEVVKKSALDTTAGEAVPHLRLDLQKNQKTNGIVWFTTFDARGVSQDGWAMKRGFLERFASEVDAPATFRVQTVTASADPLPADSQAEIESFFSLVRKALVAQMLSGKK